MAIPAGLNTKGLQPEVLIYDQDNTLQYTWQHDQIDNTPQRDFGLFGWNLHLGYGSDIGSLELFIHDQAKNLVDLTDNHIPSKIKNEWKIKFSLGKDPTGLKKWYEGFIRMPGVMRLPKYQALKLYSVGLGGNLADWDIIIKYIQAKESDGLTPDSTDTTAKVSSIATKLFSDTSLYAMPSFGTPGFTTNGITDIDSKLPDFIKNYQSIVGCMNELCNASDSIWSIDYEPSTPDILMHRKGTRSSGLLFTNDLTSLKTINWDVDKLGFLLTRPRQYNDSSIDRGYAAYLALGPYDEVLDWDKTSANAVRALYLANHSFLITPLKPSIVQLRMAVRRVGTPARDMLVYLIAADGTGAPNPAAIYSSTLIKKEILQALSTSEQYMYVSFEINPAKINPNDNIFIYIPANGDSSNYVGLSYQTGSGTYYAGGTPATGEAKLSTYFAQAVAVHYLDATAAKRTKRQLPLSMPQMSVKTALEILNGYSERMSRVRRIYEPITVSCPYDPVKPAETISYYDTFSGLETHAEIISLDLSANIYTLKGGGARTMDLQIAEVLS
jgi:hypothetical protein